MKSIRKSMWGMYWKLHDKRKRLAASLKGYLDGLPPETRRRIVLGMFAAFAVLALYTFGRAVYDIGRNDGSRMETGHAVLPFVPSPPQGDVVVFEPGSCSRVGGHIWQDGKAPALRAQSGDNQPAIALENHPADSRVKIAEDGIVQTLNARMGTGGGGMFPSLCVRSPVLEHSNAGATDVYPAGNKLQGSAGCNNGGTNVIMFENYQFANWRPGCGTLKASGGDYGGARKT